MSYLEHPTEFFGLPVVEYKLQASLPDAGRVAHRIGMDWDDKSGIAVFERVTRLAAAQSAEKTVALLIGCWALEGEEGSETIVESLVEAKDRLANLRAIYLGDITSEEQEISWITQSDVSPLFEAFPKLERFQVRGGNSLELGPIRHQGLKTLIVESGGLDADVVRDVCRSELPNLEHLELWLGVDDYGGTVTPQDLQPILSGKLFPKLKYLGIRDSGIIDELAPYIAIAPIVRRLEELDLSLGSLGDEGARALLSLPTDGTLKRLNLHHHFVSEEVIAELSKRLPFEIDTSEALGPVSGDDDGFRYVAVSE